MQGQDVGRGEGPDRRVPVRLLVVALALAVLFPAAIALAEPFTGKTPPNDPRYAPPADCSVGGQYNLYDFIPCFAPAARDPEGASGMSTARAWRDYTTGRPDALIAYVGDPINWHMGLRDLVSKIYINTKVLPPPEDGAGQAHPQAPMGGYDLNGDGIVNAADYAQDPRVSDTNHNGLIDPEDLIATFSSWCRAGGAWHRDPTGCATVDDSGDGYPHDISGWDFYDNQNDPATVDSIYSHTPYTMAIAAAEGNNHLDSVGNCPRCMLIPIRAGAEALIRDEDLARAWWYAAGRGAKVIVSLTAHLGYSDFMRQTIHALAQRGVVLVEASNDFDSTDHQGGMFWPEVMPGNAVVYDRQGLPAPLNRNGGTFRVRSNESSFGAHNFVSVAGTGGSTSEATSVLGGVAGMVVSCGLEAADQHRIAAPLSGREVTQVLRASASPIDDPTLAWAGKPGFNLQYGYGRANVDKACQMIFDNQIPPVAVIDSPTWFELTDPVQTPSLPISAHLEAARGGAYRWRVQVGLGADPAESAYRTVSSGQGSGLRDATLATVNLKDIPSSFSQAPFHLSETKTLETDARYTVSIRLQIVDSAGRLGEDRRAINVHHDPSLLPGYPIRIGHGGESQAKLVDLIGSGRLDMVFGDSDGLVHAIDPLTRRELPGWPAHTGAVAWQHPEAGIQAGHDPVLANVAVGDLDHTGALEVVATAITGQVFVFDRLGRLRPGWPRALNRGVVTPQIPRPDLPYTRQPALGATASPVLADLGHDGHLDIVQAAWDGYLYGLRPDGSDLPGWPVQVKLPDAFKPHSGYVLTHDAKLDTTPAIAYFGDGGPSIVQRSQQSETMGNNSQPLPYAHLLAYHANGSLRAGWPTTMLGGLEIYSTAQEFITEGADSPAVADIRGSGADVATGAASFGPSYAFAGDGSTQAVYGPSADSTLGLLAGQDPTQALKGRSPTDAAVTFTTSGAFGRVRGLMTYAQPATGLGSVASALSLPGTGRAISNSEAAYDASSGATLPGFPAMRQGLDFIGAPIIADVSGDGVPELVDGGDSSAMHAYTSTGTQAPGWPKFTGGWTVYSPSAGDLLGDRQTEIVSLSREGYLFAWRTQGRSADNHEWWTWHHDERNTGRYGTDTRPPSAPSDFSVAHGRACWTAPGDDWQTGTAKRYELAAFDRPPTPETFHQGRPIGGVPTPQVAGTRQCAAVGVTARYLGLRAIDAAANISYPATFASATASAAPRACTSRRRIVVHLRRRLAHGDHVVSAVVLRNGHPVRAGRGSRRLLRYAIDLRGLRSGRYVVRIVERTAGGRTLRQTRVYRTCARVGTRRTHRRRPRH